jgi:hypothetical protein
LHFKNFIHIQEVLCTSQTTFGSVRPSSPLSER